MSEEQLFLRVNNLIAKYLSTHVCIMAQKFSAPDLSQTVADVPRRNRLFMSMDISLGSCKIFDHLESCLETLIVVTLRHIGQLDDQRFVSMVFTHELAIY